MTQPAPIGHNQPPTDDEILKETLATKAKKITERMTALLAAVDRIPETLTEEQSVAVTDTIKMVQTCHAAAEDMREVEKKPYFQAGKTVDAFFSDIKAKLEAAKIKANKPLTAYHKAIADAETARRVAAEKEKKRLADEALAASLKLQEQNKPEEAAKELNKAVRADDDAAMYGAAAKVTTGLSQTKGYTGSSSSLRTTTVVEVSDRSVLDVVALLPYIALPALQTAANAWVKANPDKQLKGLTISTKTEAVVR